MSYTSASGAFYAQQERAIRIKAEGLREPHNERASLCLPVFVDSDFAWYATLVRYATEYADAYPTRKQWRLIPGWAIGLWGLWICAQDFLPPKDQVGWWAVAFKLLADALALLPTEQQCEAVMAFASVAELAPDGLAAAQAMIVLASRWVDPMVLGKLGAR